ncbi:MAG: BON domain-containing protein [Pirellulales bacterium]|nr:BON domain-containing protein [Pirellulales bacterium]
MKRIRRSVAFLVVCGVAAIGALMASGARSQDGLGERVGQAVDRTVDQLGEEARDLAGRLREGFEKARAAVDRMSVEARVYARLHWDKDLAGAGFSIDVDQEGAAALNGTVASEAAKAKAGRLAEDTVGVARVVNNLRVVPDAAR